MLVSKLRSRTSAVAIAAMTLSILSMPTGAPAQTPASSEQRLHFDIAAGPLLQTLSQYSQITGIQLVYPTSGAQGLTSPGLHGDYTAREALTRLTAGTGLVPIMVNATSATLEAPATVEGARTLGAVNVEGQQSSSFATLDGFGAGAGANGSSDPTATEGTRSFTTNGAVVASKRPQALMDTPQTVSVITQERIEQQNLVDTVQLLQQTPGITIQDNPTGPTIISRGFTVDSYRIDGGAPISGTQNANSYNNSLPNLAEFDSVQVLRGSDGLYGGAGQPGGVINFQRKRPLDHDQVTGEVFYGSFNNFRTQLDATGPVALDGHLRLRVVAADQEREFFYSGYRLHKPFVYGVAEIDLGPKTLLRFGGSYENSNQRGGVYQGVPLNEDGSVLPLPRSYGTAEPWGFDRIRTSEAFASLEHSLSTDFNIKIDYVHTAKRQTIFNLQTLGPAIGGSLTGDYLADISYQPYHNVQDVVSGTLNGAFQMFGRKQVFTIGGDYQHSNSAGSNGDNTVTSDLYPIPAALGVTPDIPDVFSQTSRRVSQWGLYGNTDLELLKGFHVSGGARVSGFVADRASSYPSFDFSSSDHSHSGGVITPYGALRYEVLQNTSLYVSYADIYNDQTNLLTANGALLPPLRGTTYEAGIKRALNNGKVNASLALYYTRENNVAFIDSSNPSAIDNCCYVTGEKQISKGIDAEVSGEIARGWQIQAGYTYNKNRQEIPGTATGALTSQQPAHQGKIWSSYTFGSGSLNNLTFSGGLRLESPRYTAGAICNTPIDPTLGYCTGDYVPFRFEQKLYTVVDLRVAYDLGIHWQASISVTNVGDTKYFTSTGALGGTSGNYYGEPRAALITLRAKY